MNKNILDKINKAKTSNILELSKIKITDEIWNEIFELTNLKSLELKECNLSALPDNISSLKKLENIILWKNNFVEFPKQLLSLNNLTRIYYIEDNIFDIPFEVSNLRHLKHFDFNSNERVSNFVYTLEKNIAHLYNSFIQFFEKKGKHVFFYFDEINFNEIDFNIIYRKNFIYLKSIDNFIFIKIEDDTEGNTGNLADYIHISIYIFGKKENRKEILLKIRNHIHKKIQRKINDLYKNYKKEAFPIISRMFYYSPIHNYLEYEKLLELKKKGENIYKEGIKNIPVGDLIDYIGIEDEPFKEWKGTNYLTKVKIQNFKIFKNTEVKFSKNINIILGNNGLGKTSILQATVIALLPNVYIEEYIRKFSTYINQSAKKAEIKINWGENENRKMWIFQRGMPREEKAVDMPHKLLLAYGVNINTNLDQRHDIVVNKLITGKSEPIFTDSIFENNYAKMHDPLIILKQLDNEIKFENKKMDFASEQIKNLNNLILRTVNDFLNLIEKTEQIQLYYNRKKQTYFFKDFNNSDLRTEQLSEGYKDHILLITDIITRILSARNLFFTKEKINKEIFAQAKGVIIIDEFDRHLHPSWQRSLLSKLKNVFKNIQFILTTHNIVSLQSAEGEHVVVLQVNKGEIEAISHKIPVGLSIEALYSRFFNENFFSENITKKINKLKEWRNKMLNKNDFSDLENEDFIKNHEDLSKISSQTSMIVNIELNQLYQQRENAKTK